MTILETLLTTLCGMIASGGIAHLFWLRRERKAVVKTAEADMAEKMISVMDKAFTSTIKRLEENVTQLEGDVVRKKSEFKTEITTLKGINEKFVYRLATLEEALIQIKECVYRSQCPVVDKLHLPNADDIEKHLRHSKDSDLSAGYSGSRGKGQLAHPGTD